MVLVVMATLASATQQIQPGGKIKVSASQQIQHCSFIISLGLYNIKCIGGCMCMIGALLQGYVSTVAVLSWYHIHWKSGCA